MDPLLLAQPACPGCGKPTPINARTGTCYCGRCGETFKP